jgi:hypothetical protein
MSDATTTRDPAVRPEAPALSEVFSDPRLCAAGAAAERGDAAEIRAIVARSAGDPEGPLDINAASPAGLNLLMYEIGARNERAVSTLLEAGASPNYKTPRGESPMLAAGLVADRRFLSLLIDRGGDVNLKNDRGEPLLLQVIDYLHWDNADLLLDRGADINAADTAGETAVHRLATINQFEQIHRYLDRGADPDRTDVTGRSLHDKVARSRVAPTSPLASWRTRVQQKLAGRKASA